MINEGTLYRATCLAYQNIKECPYRGHQTSCVDCNQCRWKFVKTYKSLEKEEKILFSEEKHDDSEQNVTSTD